MGLFDFLKKKEFELIGELQNRVAELETELDRFRPIVSIETEAERQKEELEKLIAEKEAEVLTSQELLQKLNSDYKSSLEIYTKLRKEISLYESKLDLIEFGVYEPVYDFEKSDEYRKEQNRILELQKEMISSERAAICRTNWTIDGSLSKGKANTKKYIKLTLRAFNGECESFIARVKWNNVNQMKERIKKSFDAINKLGESQTVSIQHEYLDLKIKELLLEYEFQLKRQQEKEELRAAQEALREEEKARREYEQAQKEAEKDEANFEKALEKARKEYDESQGEKHAHLLERIQKLELELKEAHERKERALSMAQQTKRGHVYIISNIGSFGEQVYKIGMTRRLEPEDRIKELGDASVPFQFDIHAMIFSDDAPTLENSLHRAFTNRKVNMLNYKKEFFKVTLDEIEEKIKEIGIEAEFHKIPEAIEYRETLAILAKLNTEESSKTTEQKVAEEFPSSLT